jgi:pimeloyl-ACP methyl ester carboxylesterase
MNLRFSMPTISIENTDFYYEIHGAGEPLVLIPGLGTGLWLWFKQVPAFAESFRTIIFDPPGVGRSAPATGEFTTRSLAATVAKLLDVLGLERAHILGASLGGFVAQEFALAYPRKTESLVLCCTSAGGARHVPSDAGILKAYASNFKLNADERIRQNLLLSFAPRYVSEHADETEQVLSMRLTNFVPDDVYMSQVRAGQTHDAGARVSQITARTLVITGDADRIVPMENSANLVAAIPQAKLEVIQGGSHLFFIEEAAKFNAAVVEFIQKVR